MYDKKLFIQQIKDGMTAREQAEYWGRPLNTINDRRWRLGFARPIPRKVRDDAQFIREVEAGTPNPVLAERYGVTSRTINRWRMELGVNSTRSTRRFTEDEKATIYRLAEDGASLSEIARTVDSTQSVIRRMVPEAAWSRKQVGQHISALNHFRKVENRARWANHDTDRL